jgi:hypothetical protein
MSWFEESRECASICVTQNSSMDDLHRAFTLNECVMHPVQHGPLTPYARSQPESIGCTVQENMTKITCAILSMPTDEHMCILCLCNNGIDGAFCISHGDLFSRCYAVLIWYENGAYYHLLCQTQLSAAIVLHGKPHESPIQRIEVFSFYEAQLCLDWQKRAYSHDPDVSEWTQIGYQLALCRCTICSHRGCINRHVVPDEMDTTQ